MNTMKQVFLMAVFLAATAQAGQAPAEKARAIYEAARISGGIVVHLGCACNFSAAAAAAVPLPLALRWTQAVGERLTSLAAPRRIRKPSALL
jgi:hypothetical protein